MTQGLFEIDSCDANGRIGHFKIPRSNKVIETPNLLPVINPKIHTISPADLSSKFGAQILITNSYIIYKNDRLRSEALEKGLHKFLDFPGAIMTDSGSFQLAEYGSIDVTSNEIIQFQNDIGSDIATPLDIPTPPDVPHLIAKNEMKTTFDRLNSSQFLSNSKMLISAPIQGSTHLDLREIAAREAYDLGFDIFPIGAAVPLLTQYRFRDLINIIMATKRGLGLDAVVHLFGAGHPMMFASAVAAGCDLFDSAAYALYARRGSYLTVQGTEQLSTLDHFPCSCPICSIYSPSEIRTLPSKERESLIAEHNLYVSFEELKRIKVAIKEGSLMDLVDIRSKSHPAMIDGYRALINHSSQIERQDPAIKKTLFCVSLESSSRPEVLRYHNRIHRFKVDSNVLLTTDHSCFSSDSHNEVWHVKPPFGPYPIGISQTYPITAEIPLEPDFISLKRAANGISILVELHPDTNFTFSHTNWPKQILETLPPNLKIINSSI